MKILKYLFTAIFLSLTFLSCSDDDDNPTIGDDPITDMNLYLIKRIDHQDHTIELYSEKSSLYVGYNEIYIRAKDASGAYIDNFTVNSWLPQMHMTMHTHASPFSEVSNTPYDSMKKGYIVFTMATNETEFWDINLDYTIANQAYNVTETIDVMMENNRRKVMNFMGSDDTMYIVAYVSPEEPKVTLNASEVLLFKKESMMSFPLVENYTITLDPRMPSMGNHSSPNNTDYTYDANDKIYKGNLSLTMTGYWKLNLKVLTPNGEIVGGTDVTETNESSDVYVEIEF